MHSIELEKRPRLPDPAKVLDGAWKLLKRTRQQLNLAPGQTVAVSGPAELATTEKKRARIEASRRKGQGTPYVFRTYLR